MQVADRKSGKTGRRPRRRARAAEAQRLQRAERLRAQGAFAAADTLYGQILDRNPVHLAALRGRAETAEALADMVEAKALPDDANQRAAAGLCAIADQCYARFLYDAALKCYRKAAALEPDRSDAVWGVAECHVALDEIAQAITWYHRYLELEPDEPEALHMLAALGDRPPPRRANDAYVAGLFNRFAGEFDDQLVRELHYRVPDHLFSALDPVLGEPCRDMDILDLGCGTGLSGELLRDYANRLDGVDLSGGMLREARARGLYDTLNEAEITRHLATAADRYDLVMAADVLGYFGALSDVFRGVARVMRDGALFAFSVEAHEGPGYRLTRSGRYVHGRRYIERLAAAAGLRAVSLADEILRYEYGEAVEGDIWVFEKPV